MKKVILMTLFGLSFVTNCMAETKFGHNESTFIMSWLSTVFLIQVIIHALRALIFKVNFFKLFIEFDGNLVKVDPFNIVFYLFYFFGLFFDILNIVFRS